MFVDSKRYKRAELSPDKFEFLQRLMPFGRLIQQMSWEKSKLARIYSPMGMCASLAMADIIVKSDWGVHEAARKENNLSLLLKAAYWKGRSVEIDGLPYRSYSSWLDYSIDATDEMTFFEKKLYEPILLATNLDAQLDLMSSLHQNNTDYGSRIEEIIERYGLWEFDY